MICKRLREVTTWENEKGVILMRTKQSGCIQLKGYTFDSEKNCYVRVGSKKPLIATGFIIILILGLLAVIAYSLLRQNAMAYAYQATIDTQNSTLTTTLESEQEVLFGEIDVTHYELEKQVDESDMVSAAVAPQTKKNLSTATQNEPINSEGAQYTFASEDFKLSDEDYQSLLRIVEAEATDEDLIGKILVANVVFNRVRWKGFPSTVSGVIFDPGQFSPIRDGRFYSVKVTNSTVEAVSRALAGEDYSQGALFFVARSMADQDNVSWFDTKLKRVLKYGVHEFFVYR